MIELLKEGGELKQQLREQYDPVNVADWLFSLNQSVFEILRSFFRTAKAVRQVFIVTHNPNLVVNTDAEQIIVAACTTQENGLPRIRYLRGALESCDLGDPPKSMKERVCTILEGGREAFRQRERKYQRVLRI